MKKILILSYLEGASRIEFVGRIGGNYAIERQVCDVNACVETLVSHGAEVYVCDLYQKGREIFPRDLTEKAKVVKTPDLEELCKSGLDGVFLIGAHAKNGAGNAFYTYTVNEVSWFSYSLNGAELGDIGIAHAYFGYFGIPVLLVSGDDGACREAEEGIKGVVTAIVKKATCRNYATCLLEEDAKKVLEEKSVEALEKIGEISPCPKANAYEIEVTYSRVDYCDECMFYYIGRAERVSPIKVRRKLEVLHGIHDLKL
jgi:D-amino peptidase